MSPAEVVKLENLWSALSEYDKKRTVFPSRFSKNPPGRFRRKRKRVAPGVESIKKVFLGPNQGPAQWPNCNRYTEATIEKLLQVYPSDRRRKEEQVITKWSLILDAYHNIRKTVLNNHQAMKATEIQLPLLNKKTLQYWFNEKSKAEEKKVLVQGLMLPTSKAPDALTKPTSLSIGSTDPFSFHEPPSTIGMAKLKSRPKKPPPTPRQGVTFILPQGAPRNPGITFQVIPPAGCYAAPIPTASSIGQSDKRKGELQETKAPKRKYVRKAEITRCSKCGGDIKSSDHFQYMGYRYCRNRNHSI